MIATEDIQAIADAVTRRLAAADKLLDNEELAARLDIHPQTLKRLIYEGRLPQGYLVGGQRRWDWSEVKKFLAGRPTVRRRRKAKS